MDTQGSYFIDFKNIPPSVILILGGVFVCILYTIYKSKKNRVPTPFEKALGTEFEQALKNFRLVIKNVQNANIQGNAEEALKVSRSISKLVMGFSNKTVETKISQDYIDMIFKHVRMQIPTVIKLISSYKELEKDNLIASDAASGTTIKNDVNSQNNQLMMAIEYEMSIIPSAFSSLYNLLREVAYGKKTRKKSKSKANTGNNSSFADETQYSESPSEIIKQLQCLNSTFVGYPANESDSKKRRK